MSAARQDRRDRKKAQFEEKRGERKSRVWGGDLDRKQRTPVLVAKGAVEGKTAVLSNHDREELAKQRAQDRLLGALGCYGSKILRLFRTAN